MAKPSSVVLSCKPNGECVGYKAVFRWQNGMKNFDVVKMAAFRGFFQTKASKCIKRESNLSYWSWKKEKWFISGKPKPSFAIEGVQQTSQQSIKRSFCNWKYSYFIDDFCWQQPWDEFLQWFVNEFWIFHIKFLLSSWWNVSVRCWVFNWDSCWSIFDFIRRTYLLCQYISNRWNSFSKLKL